MIAGFARAVIRFRRAVIPLWIAAAVGAALWLPDLEEAGTGSLGDLVATEADAIDAEVRAATEFRFPLLSRTVVVQRDPRGLSLEAHARAARRVLDLNLSRLPGLEGIAFALLASNALGEPPFSRERSTTILTYLFFPPDIGRVGRTGLARRLVERHVSHPEDGLVGITGAVPARSATVERVRDALPVVELATLIAVALVMGLYFRALAAPLANVAAIAIAFVIAIRAVASIGSLVGLAVPDEVEPVIVALLFGIVTDYTIFFLSRFRARLRDGEAPTIAAERATAELLPIIVAAGLTVAAAAGALAISRLGFYQAFGPGMAVSVLVALAVATTFVPAMLAVLGRRIFWPGRLPRPGRGGSAGSHRLRPVLARARQAVLDLPARHPLAVALVTVFGLVALASGVLRLEVGDSLIRGLPRDSEPRVALRAASAGFSPGIIAPTVVLVEAPSIIERRAEVARLQELLGRRRGIAEVLGPREVPAPIELGAALSPTGDAVRYLAVLDLPPLSSRAIRLMERLQGDMPGLLARAGLADAEASFAGDTALAAETVTKTREDLTRVAPAAVLAVFCILAVFLRALVAPVYLVLASLLALGASLGVAVYVFQDLLGYGQLTFYVPFVSIVLLVALGSDYNIYLVGRIWTEARRRPLRQAVEVAGTRAARAITIAGLVLALSFALLALVPLRPFQELAFALAIGLLIDAFVVRMLLAPALIILVGERSGWPGKRLVRRGRAAASRLRERRR